MIAPGRVRDWVQFEKSAIEYAIEICAGMPLWMWYIGALTTHAVKGGKATISDVKRAVELLVSDEKIFFTPVKTLQPLEFEISLEPNREFSYLWLLLYKLAAATATIDRSAPRLSFLDRDLLALDTEQAWLDRLSRLSELKIIVPNGKNFYSFIVPIFAEAFRAPHLIETFRVEEQKVS